MSQVTKIQANSYPRRKKKKSAFRASRLIILVLVVVAIGSSGWKLWQLHRDVEMQLAELSTQKQSLLAEQRDLNDKIARLNTPSYVEQLAREQLGLVRQGEIMISPKK